jgi:hypothetical protein
MPARLEDSPSQDQLEDAVFCARYDELDELRAFVDEHGAASLVEAKDANGNGCLHMAAGNGHEGLRYSIAIIKRIR